MHLSWFHHQNFLQPCGLVACNVSQKPSQRGSRKRLGFQFESNACFYIMSCIRYSLSLKSWPTQNMETLYLISSWFSGLLRQLNFAQCEKSSVFMWSGDFHDDVDDNDDAGGCGDYVCIRYQGLCFFLFRSLASEHLKHLSTDSTALCSFGWYIIPAQLFDSTTGVCASPNGPVLPGIPSLTDCWFHASGPQRPKYCTLLVSSFIPSWECCFIPMSFEILRVIWSSDPQKNRVFVTKK